MPPLAEPGPGATVVIPPHPPQDRSRSSAVMHPAPEPEVPGSNPGGYWETAVAWHGTSATAGDPRFRSYGPHDNSAPPPPPPLVIATQKCQINTVPAPTVAWTGPWTPGFKKRRLHGELVQGGYNAQISPKSELCGFNSIQFTTNVSMTPCDWQIRHQTNVLCDCTTFVRHQIKTAPAPAAPDCVLLTPAHLPLEYASITPWGAGGRVPCRLSPQAALCGKALWPCMGPT